MTHTGKIIVLAYPDTFVTMSNEFICRLLPLVGLGTQEYIKAGHAALVLIENDTGKLQYYDFGRYVTPPGFGRVRGENTDAELEMPFNAQISGVGQLENLDEILRWLDANPQKTHGDGRLLASVCNAINFDEAKNFIHSLQQKGSIPYGAFDKKGSNCARFVADTLLASTSDKKIKMALLKNKLFTPSTVGNVEKAADGRKVYEIANGSIAVFKKTALHENLKNYFDKKKPPSPHDYSPERPCLTTLRSTVQKLEGAGSSAWFELITDDSLAENEFRIKRYNEFYEQDFDGVFTSEEFNPELAFEFTYDSHCMHCHVIQNNRKLKLKNIGVFRLVSSKQKAHIA